MEELLERLPSLYFVPFTSSAQRLCGCSLLASVADLLRIHEFVKDHVYRFGIKSPKARCFVMHDLDCLNHRRKF